MITLVENKDNKLGNETSRKTKLETWLCSKFGQPAIELKALQNDASFRQYYRCTINNSSYVVMDAPPDKENINSFIKMTEIMSRSYILVPDLISYDLEQGFIVLSDFGDKWLLEQLKQESPAQVSAWYYKAIDSLLQIQQVSTNLNSDYTLPVFNRDHISLELSYFSEWFLEKKLQLSLTSVQRDMLDKIYQQLVQSALQEPQVLIHRDYHSRNLMVLQDERLGIIDYQDAMIGPLSYDLVSLLKDCYITWPEDQRNQYITYFHEKSTILGLTSEPWAQFKQAADWMGLQRHLKVLGIFSRLSIRDNKIRYLDDMPRIIDYIMQVVSAYPEFSEFHTLWRTVILPAFSERNLCVS